MHLKLKGLSLSGSDSRGLSLSVDSGEKASFGCLGLLVRNKGFEH